MALAKKGAPKNLTVLNKKTDKNSYHCSIVHHYDLNQRRGAGNLLILRVE